ncbi:hypothetical protein C8J56DRAFT_879956 [Mycena floridula]|nr:hypothetical protein C8J56DRAFT_879956 [Mycena floridula]
MLVSLLLATRILWLHFAYSSSSSDSMVQPMIPNVTLQGKQIDPEVFEDAQQATISLKKKLETHPELLPILDQELDKLKQNLQCHLDHAAASTGSSLRIFTGFSSDIMKDLAQIAPYIYRKIRARHFAFKIKHYAVNLMFLGQIQLQTVHLDPDPKDAIRNATQTLQEAAKIFRQLYGQVRDQNILRHLVITLHSLALALEKSRESGREEEINEVWDELEAHCRLLQQAQNPKLFGYLSVMLDPQRSIAILKRSSKVSSTKYINMYTTLG